MATSKNKPRLSFAVGVRRTLPSPQRNEGPPMTAALPVSKRNPSAFRHPTSAPAVGFRRAPPRRRVVVLALPAWAFWTLVLLQIPEREGPRRRACADPEPSPLSYSSRLSLLSRLSEPVSLALVLPSGFDASAGIVMNRPEFAGGSNS